MIEQIHEPDDTIADLERDVEDLKDEIVGLENKIETLENDLYNLEEENSQLKNTEENLVTKVDKLEEQLEDANEFIFKFTIWLAEVYPNALKEFEAVQEIRNSIENGGS